MPQMSPMPWILLSLILFCIFMAFFPLFKFEEGEESYKDTEEDKSNIKKW